MFGSELVNQVAVQAMAEEGIDISTQTPKILTTESVRLVRDDINQRVVGLARQLSGL